MLKGILFDFNRTLYDPDQGTFFAGVRTMLEGFKTQGLKQGVVSFGGAEKEKLIQDLGLDRLVDWYMAVPEKTAEVFLSFLQKFDLKPSETSVVGDLVNSEIRIGRELGMKTVWLKAGKFAGEVPEVEPDFVINQIADLGQIVLELMKD